MSGAARQASASSSSRATSSSTPCAAWSVTRATTGQEQRYLIQHSAGSGKSFTIAWLAHQLSTLHDTADRRVFDSIVVVTDRRVLDRQLQHDHAPVRADPRGGGEHRHHLATAQAGPRVGEDDHRHHAPEVPGDRRGDRRAAGQALRRDRGRGALVAVGREHEEPQVGARFRKPGGRGAGGGRGGDARGGAGERDPGRDGEAGPAPQPLDVRLHSDAQAEDAGAVRDQARRREVRVLPSLQHAPGDRRGFHPRRPPELHDLQGVLAAPQDDRGRPALRQEQGRLSLTLLRRAAPPRHQREGPDHGRALRRPGAEPDRRQGQGHDRDTLATARRTVQARRGPLPP